MLLLNSVYPAGQPQCSTSALLRLPIEILSDIVGLVCGDRKSLENLAQVNSDCLRLAQCYQLANVTLDYSARFRRLLKRLSTERMDPTGND
jgi:hypothetical protein